MEIIDEVAYAIIDDAPLDKKHYFIVFIPDETSPFELTQQVEKRLEDIENEWADERSTESRPEYSHRTCPKIECVDCSTITRERFKRENELVRVDPNLSEVRFYEDMTSSSILAFHNLVGASHDQQILVELTMRDSNKTELLIVRKSENVNLYRNPSFLALQRDARCAKLIGLD